MSKILLGIASLGAIGWAAVTPITKIVNDLREMHVVYHDEESAMIACTEAGGNSIVQSPNRETWDCRKGGRGGTLIAQFPAMRTFNPAG